MIVLLNERPWNVDDVKRPTSHGVLADVAKVLIQNGANVNAVAVRGHGTSLCG